MAKKIGIDIEANSKDAKSGLDEITKSLNQLSKIAQKNKFNQIASSYSGVSRAFRDVNNAVKKVIDGIKECSELYKVQRKAEIQLQTAAKNNPYLNSESVRNLKNYASQLQSISDIGDEQLLPFMAQLAASGRTEAEIQQIMNAALDASASGMISLDSAVKALNASYSGNVGQLGKLLPGLKSLTKEELESGKAVSEVQKAYKGLAQNTTDSSKQLKNSIGDLKEQLGRGWDEAFTPLRKGIQSIIDKWTEAIKKQKDAKDDLKNLNNVLSGGAGDVSSATKTQTQLVVDTASELDTLKRYNQLILKEKKDRTKEEQKELTNMRGAVQLYLQQFQDGTKTEEELVKEATAVKQAEYDKQFADLQNLVAKDKQLRVEEAEAAAKAQTEAEKKALEERRDLLRKEYNETIANAQKNIEIRRSLGEEISEEAEAQELLNIATAAYIKMYSDPAFDTKLSKTGIWSGQKEQQGQIKGWADKSNVSEEAENHVQELFNKLHPEVAKLTQEIVELDALASQALAEGLDESSEEYQDYIKERIRLSNRLKEIERDNAEETKKFTKEQLQEVLSIAGQMINNLASAASTLSDVVQQNAQNEATVELAALEKQYNDGIISEQEYYQQKEEIEKEAAEKTYQAQMWAWGASLAQIGVSTAQAVVNALAMSGPPWVGIAMAATVGILGAVQLAAAIANKPVKPSYATGGIVGGASGASMGNDNVYAHVRKGEMILNAKQQRALWEMANGGTGGTSTNVEVRNYRGSDTKVDAQFDENGLKLLVRKTVNDDLANRKYNKSLMAAQNSFQGKRYQS